MENQGESKIEKTRAALNKVLVKFDLTPAQIMMRLDKIRLKRAQKQFLQSEEGLDLIEFVKMLLAEVPCEENERIELINGAINIFKDVDINGDGNMSWNEFV